jgi:hypothetical protein
MVLFYFIILEYMNNITDDDVTTSERFQTTTGDFINDIIQPTAKQSPILISPYRIINIVLVLVILSILGINILGYTELVIEKVIQFIDPVFKFFGYSIISLTDTTLEKTRQGTKFATDAIVDSSQALLSDVSDLLEIPSSSVKSGQAASIRYGENTDEPTHDDSLSEIQRGSSSKTKPGYCYIGTDRGVRSCVKVGQYDKCMSGEVFPRMDICINPALRT